MEQWRDVVEYRGYYQVSNMGRVRSLDRVVPHARFGTWRLKGRIIHSSPRNQYGHLGVGLRKDGVARNICVHRLVAAAFIGPCPSGQQVRHGSKGKLNNSVSNLRYGTKSEDELDKRRDGTHGGRAVRRSDGAEFISMCVAAEETGCWQPGIWRVCNGINKTAGGYGWEYV